MIATLNSRSGILLISALIRSLAMTLLVLSLRMNSSVLTYCVSLSVFFCVLRKPVMFPAPKANGYIEKRLCAEQGLTLQEVFLVNAVCILLLCFGCSFPRVISLQNSSLPTVRCVWILAGVW